MEGALASALPTDRVQVPFILTAARGLAGPADTGRLDVARLRPESYTDQTGGRLRRGPRGPGGLPRGAHWSECEFVLLGGSAKSYGSLCQLPQNLNFAVM